MSQNASRIATPGNVPLAFVQANQLLLHGHAAQARKMLRPLLAQHPTDPWIASTTLISIQHTTPATRWAQEMAPLESPATPLIIRLILNTLRAVGAWHSCQPDLFQKLLAQANDMSDQLTQHGMDNCRCHEEAVHLQSSFHNLTAYLSMFNTLGHGPLQPPKGQPFLYMVGDSHTLPPHHQTVAYQGKPHTLESRLVMGLKLWHMARPEDTMQRASLARTLSEVPPQATILLSAGEIDCRVNEGIWAYAHKTKRPLEDVIRRTCHQALNWLAIQNHPRHYIISGIPAPRYIRDKHLFPTLEAHTTYALAVKQVNDTLREEALSHGWDFLDLHSLTGTAQGFSTDAWHLEKTHLKPRATAEAFTHHLQSA